MKIKDFIEGRNVSYQTVRKYVVQHPEKFKGHVGRANNIVLDDVAVQLLDAKYPYPQPVEIVQDTAAREELQELQSRMIEALETINRLQAENAELRLLQHKQELLEHNIDAQAREITKLRDHLQKAESDLIIEKNKTWWDKLRRR